MKILVLEPVAVDTWNRVTEEYVRRVVEPTTEVIVRHLPEGPKSIECEFDIAEAAPHVVREVVRAEKEEFDGVVINCFDDPGLDAAREVVDILVLGIGETSITMATLLGHKFAIISTGPNVAALYHRRVMKLGLSNRLAYVSGLKIPVLELRRDEHKLVDILVKESMKAINMGAEVIVLGCGGFIGLADELSKKTGVPVIDPTLTTVKVAEGLIKLGLKHSKAHLYNVPSHKRREIGELKRGLKTLV